MKYKVYFLDEAENDLDESYVWYEIQKINLGDEFIININQSVNNISENPFHCEEVYKNIRKKIVSKFPFLIYYYIEQEKKEIKIIAVLHAKRNPKIWKTRIHNF